MLLLQEVWSHGGNYWANKLGKRKNKQIYNKREKQALNVV